MGLKFYIIYEKLPVTLFFQTIFSNEKYDNIILVLSRFPGKNSYEKESQ